MKKIAENDKSIFYKNEMTKDYGDDFKTVLVELKETGEKEYLLLYKNKPIYANSNIEAIWCRRDILKKT